LIRLFFEANTYRVACFQPLESYIINITWELRGVHTNLCYSKHELWKEEKKGWTNRDMVNCNEPQKIFGTVWSLPWPNKLPVNLYVCSIILCKELVSQSDLEESVLLKTPRCNITALYATPEVGRPSCNIGIRRIW
ncbi:hypothetical protein LINPERPRIM_LOCUS18852, partial [Linum perenne]